MRLLRMDVGVPCGCPARMETTPYHPVAVPNQAYKGLRIKSAETTREHESCSGAATAVREVVDMVEGTRVLSGPTLLAGFYIGLASHGSHATIITLHDSNGPVCCSI